MYYIESSNTGKKLFEMSSFNREIIKLVIIHFLTLDGSDTLMLYKECKSNNYVGDDIIGYYEVNPKNQEISKCVIMSEKIYYRSLVKK
jgi:hypothetical protein